MQEDQDLKYKEENVTDEKEIDLLELAAKLWAKRKKLMLWTLGGAVIGVIIALSIPKEYSSVVTLVPELSDKKSAGGGLSSLASMAGISLGSGSGADAVNPQLYPDIVKSVPFTTSLFDVVVETNEKGDKCTVRQYLEEDIRHPWWGYILGLPGKIIGLLRSNDHEEEAKDKKVDNFRLTLKEDMLVQALNHRITTSVDQKTSVITINVDMQDPLVAAILADTVVSRLRDYITEYRTNKARKDLEYAQKMNAEAQAKYYEAQQRYADYLDRNQGLILYSAQTTRDRLENESQLAFNLYNQTEQQVQAAAMKVQETTPVYTTITPASVPLKPTSPKKMLIVVGFAFLAFVAYAAWILFVAPMIEEQKGKFSKEEEDSGNK